MAAPLQPGTGAGSGACEGQTGSTACKMGVSLPAVSDVPRKVEVQPKVSDITYSVVAVQIYIYKSYTFFEEKPVDAKCNTCNVTVRYSTVAARYEENM